MLHDCNEKWYRLIDSASSHLGPPWLKIRPIWRSNRKYVKAKRRDFIYVKKKIRTKWKLNNWTSEWLILYFCQSVALNPKSNRCSTWLTLSKDLLSVVHQNRRDNFFFLVAEFYRFIEHSNAVCIWLQLNS